MGSIAALNSINRVMEAHAEEIRQEYEGQVPASVRPFLDRVELEASPYQVDVVWVFKDGILAGPSLDIDVLAERYPDCEVGY